MATILTMLSPKGGAGKTTLALSIAGELAHRGKNVSVVDADPNQPWGRWNSKGAGPKNIKVLVDTAVDGSEIIDNIKLARVSADTVIIDTEGTMNTRAMIAVQAADLVLVPFNPSFEDIYMAAQAVKFIKTMSASGNREIKFVVVPTQLSPASFGMSKQTSEALAQVRDSGHPILKHSLKRREAFKLQQHYGATVHSLKDSQAPGLEKARLDASNVTDEILRLAQTSKSQLKATG